MAGKRAPFPTKDQVAEFIESSDQPVGKREIARAFHIKGDDRPRLKALLRELADDGVLERSAGRRFGPPDSLPAVAVLTIARISDDGDLLAVPTRHDPETKPPRIHVVEDRKISGQLGTGDRV
ncbi:MAG: ribonuclease R, partial [Pseudomonadota bacterium]